MPTRCRPAWVCASLAIAGLCTTGGVKMRSENAFSALPLEVKYPPDNPSTADKVSLGRLLFWDPILSGGRDVACATCHHPSDGYTDHRDLSIGVHGVGLGVNRRFVAGNQIPFAKRNSPTLLNAAFNGIGQTGDYDPALAPMFWDARAKSLEDQALEPMRAMEEMRGDRYAREEILPAVVDRLADVPEYRGAFARAFGGPEPVSIANLAKALASFERTLVTANAPFDRFMRGDRAAMSAEQIQGMAQFERAGCASCHNGPMFSDYRLHVLGVPDSIRLTAPDTGANNRYAFRTPTLRNLAYTAPYTHGGVFPTLDAVLNFYNVVSNGRGGGRRGRPGGPGRGGVPGPPDFGGPPGRGGPSGRGPRINPEVRPDQLDPLLRQVDVRGGRSEILQFLDALNDDAFDRTIPDRVPSGLPPGGSIK